MPPSAAARAPRRRVAVVRGLAFTAAVALGAVALWLIVTSPDKPQRIEIGVLIGLWGALLGAYAVFGTRTRAREPVPVPPVPVAPPAPPAAPGQQLDLRKSGELERAVVSAAVAAARREFQAELEAMLRREVQAGLAQELAGLRAEVAALRNELVEKVGGQLRLERIETTRLIGSDLEAVQHELRQLREIGSVHVDLDDDGPMSRVINSQVHEAEIVAERVMPLERVEPSERVGPSAPQPSAGRPAASEGSAPEPVAMPEPEPASPAFVGDPADPFASLPRIRPFTDFRLDPIPEPAAPEDVPDRLGRHATEDAGAGRRHRADDESDDVLARILAREGRS